MRPNLYGIGRSTSNQYGLGAARRGLGSVRARSVSLGLSRFPRRQHSGILASIVIPFSARLGKLKCRNSWGNIGFLLKKNILLRHCNDASDIMEYFQSIIQCGVRPLKWAVIENLPATWPLVPTGSPSLTSSICYVFYEFYEIEKSLLRGDTAVCYYEYSIP